MGSVSSAPSWQLFLHSSVIHLLTYSQQHTLKHGTTTHCHTQQLDIMMEKQSCCVTKRTRAASAYTSVFTRLVAQVHFGTAVWQELWLHPTGTTTGLARTLPQGLVSSRHGPSPVQRCLPACAGQTDEATTQLSHVGSCLLGRLFIRLQCVWFICCDTG
ncbi:hypothetical protein COO60DRAFT_1229656 [Scenedesmus sp. NREL 46B-D3]|nr:hypothetical protein COO60DRAFT_1229656 [Scenedesmus sp. NREL 46B-D3]